MIFFDSNVRDVSNIRTSKRKGGGRNNRTNILRQKIKIKKGDI